MVAYEETASTVASPTSMGVDNLVAEVGLSLDDPEPEAIISPEIEENAAEEDLPRDPTPSYAVTILLSPLWTLLRLLSLFLVVTLTILNLLFGAALVVFCIQTRGWLITSIRNSLELMLLAPRGTRAKKQD